MTQAIWNGSISIGILNIPVKLYKASNPANPVSFRQINSATNNPIAMKRVDSVTNDPVEYADIVKGYEIEQDSYIVIDPEEIAELHPTRSTNLEIIGFVDKNEIDPDLYEEPYALGTDEANGKSYHLLAQSMHDIDKVAVAKLVLRQNERVCIIRPTENGLRLNVLRWSSQMRDLDSVVPEQQEPTTQEMDLMFQLMDTLPKELSVDEFENDYNDKVVELIEAKAAGEEIIQRVPQYKADDNRSILELLSESVERAKTTQHDSQDHV